MHVVYFLVQLTLTKQASQKRLLNEELKQWFLLNVYVNVSICFFAHKLLGTLENLTLHFVVGIGVIHSVRTQNFPEN